MQGKGKHDRDVLEEYLQEQDRLEEETGEGIELLSESATEVTRVIAERNRQIEIWGIQRLSLAEWSLVLGEEYGEAIQAATPLYFAGESEDWDDLSSRIHHLREELTHTAAVAISWMEHLTESLQVIQERRDKEREVADAM